MKTFYFTFFLSVLLIVSGFLIPPVGVIDGSVLTAVGLLLMFCVVAQIPTIIEAVKDGKSIKVTKGDFSAEVKTVKEEEGERVLSS